MPARPVSPWNQTRVTLQVPEPASSDDPTIIQVPVPVIPAAVETNVPDHRISTVSSRTVPEDVKVVLPVEVTVPEPGKGAVTVTLVPLIDAPTAPSTSSSSSVVRSMTVPE